MVTSRGLHRRSFIGRGFTLVELLVVMAIVATLLSLVAPRYFRSVDHAKEVTLKTNLRTVRDAIDKFHADSGAYPDSLQVLVTQRYLRDLPIDPVTDSSATWILVGHPNRLPGVYDLRSGATGNASDGTLFADW